MYPYEFIMHKKVSFSLIILFYCEGPLRTKGFSAAYIFYCIITTGTAYALLKHEGTRSISFNIKPETKYLPNLMKNNYAQPKICNFGDHVSKCAMKKE